MEYLNQENINNFINQEETVIVDFYAEWCTPCKMMNPIFENMSQEGYKIGKVDVDNNKELAAEYGIKSIPTILFFKNGKQLEKFAGATDKDKLIKTLNQIDGGENTKKQKEE